MGAVVLSVQVEHGNDLTAAPEQLQGSTKSLPCLESLYIHGSDKLATLPNIPPSLKELSVYHCPELRSISGHLDVQQAGISRVGQHARIKRFRTP